MLTLSAKIEVDVYNLIASHPGLSQPS